MPQPMQRSHTDRKSADHPEKERRKLKAMTDKELGRFGEYYLNLIDWSDPHDPIRRLAAPQEGQWCDYGRIDQFDEAVRDAAPGCRHLYRTTAALFPTDRGTHTAADMESALDYIAAHPEIDNVLLTGGDSLMLGMTALHALMKRLRDIPHVKVIRLDSKLPVVNPMRIYEDGELLDMFRALAAPDNRIYVMAHINHPREITEETKRGIQALQDAGVVVVNQTPVRRGINGDPRILGELLDKLSWAGITPYNFYINRPAPDKREFALTLREAYRIMEQAKARTSGLGKLVRLSMRHTSGVIEIMAIENGTAYLKYVRTQDGQLGDLIVLDCPDDAAWFDDLPGNERYWANPDAVMDEPLAARTEQDDDDDDYMPPSSFRRAFIIPD